MHSTQFMFLARPNTGTWNTSLSRSERRPAENAPIDTGKRGAIHKTVPRTHSPEGPSGKFWREKIIAEVRIARVTFLFLTFALSRKYWRHAEDLAHGDLLDLRQLGRGEPGEGVGTLLVEEAVSPAEPG